MADQIWIPVLRSKYQKTCVFLANKTREHLVDIITGFRKNISGKNEFYQDYGQYTEESYRFAVCGGSKSMKSQCCLNKIGCCDEYDFTVQVAACLLVIIVLTVLWMWICQLYLLKRHMDDMMITQKKTFLIGHLPVGQKDLSKLPFSEENLYCLPDLPKSKASKSNPLDSPFRQPKLKAADR